MKSDMTISNKTKKSGYSGIWHRPNLDLCSVKTRKEQNRLA